LNSGESEHRNTYWDDKSTAADSTVVCKAEQKRKNDGSTNFRPCGWEYVFVRANVVLALLKR
jgi:hypothetical protein